MLKKTQPKNDVLQEEIVFSDTDDEEERYSGVQGEVEHQQQQRIYPLARSFKMFLSEPTFINSRGDASTNIVDIFYKKCYNITDRKISKFMNFLENMRRKNLKVSMYEKQQEYSGIMLDFDIKLNAGGESPITRLHYHRLCITVFKVIMKYIHFTDENNTHKNFHVGFIKKPKILYDNEGEYYKDGIHMIIPGIKITREVKKLIISDIKENKLLENVFKNITPHESITRTDFLDENSAHVGVFFIGSSSKPNTLPYYLDSVYNVSITIGDIDDIIPVIIDNFTSKENNYNICYEFSLNWEKKKKNENGVDVVIVKKNNYDIKKKYESILEKYSSKPNSSPDEFENNNHYSDLSILNMHDPDAEYIKSLLDILHPSRSEEYSLWFDVLCSLAHTSPSYKTLAEYFSRKSPEKFDSVSFEQIWDSILSKKNKSLSMGSLHYWARLDNPDRYEEVRQSSVFSLLFKKIYNPTVEGWLEHFDVAEILYNVLQNKYVYDKCDGECGSWYEFIMEGDPMIEGELYKWRKYNGRSPKSLLKYISKILPDLFEKVTARVKKTLDECDTDLAKYYYNIYKNCQKSTRSLKNSGFKHSTSTECEQLFEKIGFANKLDSDPNLLGVANGILHLGKKSKLITGFHGHLVSKFTTSKYIKFNPHDALTKKILIALRNLFPDSEPDTFSYIMHYLASTLDGHKKESIMLIIVGKGSNGKSFLTELHKGAIGSTYGVKMPLSFLTSRAKNSESATPALMQLKEAHFAYYSESNKFETLNMAKIKEFTGQETLAGRKLHSDYINFKPKCHHLVASNNDFEIMGTDHGTWRRLVYMIWKITFGDKPDKNNPYERKSDPDMGSHWAENPDVVSRYLGIIVYYYESFLSNYHGQVSNVPHPHILAETEEFRNRQDNVNKFLSSTLVKCSDEDKEMSIIAVREIYIKWYESNFPGSSKDYQRFAVDQLENSKIQKFIKKTRRGNFLKGYRILDIGEEKEEDEEYFMDTGVQANNDISNIKPESSLEYYNRLCKEYDLNNMDSSNSKTYKPNEGIDKDRQR